MNTVRLSQKGQLVLPKSIRTELGLEPGAFIDIRVVKNAIVLSPRKKGPLDSLYGRFKHETVIDELEKEHESEIKGELPS
jgi:AbrB family looped-hinge helix DNA binding protein